MDNTAKAQDILSAAQKKAAKLLADAEIQAAIVTALPAVPCSVHVYPLYGCVASASYEVKTKREAWELYTLFDTILPTFIVRDGMFTSIRCTDLETAKSSQEVHATVVVDRYAARLEFHVPGPTGTIEVSIKMPTGLFGRYVEMDANRVKYWYYAWQPLPETKAMSQLVCYAPSSDHGTGSARTYVYGLSDRQAVANQFNGGSDA